MAPEFGAGDACGGFGLDYLELGLGLAFEDFEDHEHGGLAAHAGAGGAHEGVVFGVEAGGGLLGEAACGGGEAFGALGAGEGGAGAVAGGFGLGLCGGFVGAGGALLGAGVAAGTEGQLGHEGDADGIHVADTHFLAFETEANGGHGAGGGAGHADHRAGFVGFGGGETESGEGVGIDLGGGGGGVGRKRRFRGEAEEAADLGERVVGHAGFLLDHEAKRGDAGLEREAVGDAAGAGGEAGIDRGEDLLGAFELAGEQGGAGLGGLGFGEGGGDLGAEFAGHDGVVGLGHGDDGGGAVAIGGAFAGLGERLAEGEFPHRVILAHRFAGAGIHGLELRIGEASGGCDASAGGFGAGFRGAQRGGLGHGDDERDGRGRRDGRGVGVRGNGEDRDQRGGGEAAHGKGGGPILLRRGSAIGGGNGGLPDRGHRGGVEFREVFGGGLVESLETTLAAETHLAVRFVRLFVNMDVGIAHRAEGLAGDDTGVDRIGRVGFRRRGIGGEGRRGEREEGEELFHGKRRYQCYARGSSGPAIIFTGERAGLVGGAGAGLVRGMIHPGLVSITFRKLSPAEIVALVRKAGLRGIEWGGDIHVPHGDIARAREVAAMTQEAGLHVAAYGSYYRAGWSETNGLPFKQVLDSALELGAPTIRVWPGNKGSADVGESGRWEVIEDLRRIAGLAAQVGVTISTEFHGGTLTDTNESANQLLVEVDHPNLFTYWQPHNGEETAECVAGLRAVASRVSNVHVFHWWPTSADRHPLAEGAARWAEFLRELKALSGERFAMLEFVKGDDPDMFLRDAATLAEWLR